MAREELHQRTVDALMIPTPTMSEKKKAGQEIGPCVGADAQSRVAPPRRAGVASMEDKKGGRVGSGERWGSAPLAIEDLASMAIATFPRRQGQEGRQEGRERQGQRQGRRQEEEEGRRRKGKKGKGVTRRCQGQGCAKGGDGKKKKGKAKKGKKKKLTGKIQNCIGLHRGGLESRGAEHVVQFCSGWAGGEGQRHLTRRARGSSHLLLRREPHGVKSSSSKSKIGDAVRAWLTSTPSRRPPFLSYPTTSPNGREAAPARAPIGRSDLVSMTAHDLLEKDTRGENRSPLSVTRT